MSLVEADKVEPLAVLDKEEEVGFVWGRKRGVGGKRKEVQFYESFTYDGVEYALYDSVYMHKEGELPYIGKIIKIWENPDKSRKIKIHWFFRSTEILYHLKDVKVAENEVFIASGEGTGLANVNPLESSKWFKAPPWEEVMQTSNEQGTLILLENLNPEYTSGEVEDIIWHACRENCTAKMVQRTAFSSLYSGRALVAFKTREAAERVCKKLADGCLMVSNQRPLVASFVTLPKMEGNTPSFAGHLCVDKLRLQLQREMKEAVSTSHCSQPNTIEHEMGMEWRLLHSRSDSWWNRLYKQQNEELRKTESELKRK